MDYVAGTILRTEQTIRRQFLPLNTAVHWMQKKDLGDIHFYRGCGEGGTCIYHQ